MYKISNELTGDRNLLPEGNGKVLVFSIFSCGCKQYKSIHINSGTKIQNN